MKTSNIVRIAVLLGLLLLAQNARAGEAVGFIASVTGTVEILPAGQKSWTAAGLDGDVQLDDTIRTGENSAIKLLMNDDTTLSIGAETELVLDSFAVGHAAPEKRSVIRLMRGHIRAWIGEIFGGPSRVEMHTPTAVIGVKGTAYDVWVEEKNGEFSTLVCVTHGAITVRPLQAEVGTDEELGMGSCAQVGEDGRVLVLSTRPDGYDPIDNSIFGKDPLVADFQKPLFIEDLLVSNPPVGLAPTVAPSGSDPAKVPDGDPITVAISLQPHAAPEDPILNGEDPLHEEDWFEDPLRALDQRGHPGVVPDADGIGSNLQVYKIFQFYNFDTQKPDMRVFVR